MSINCTVTVSAVVAAYQAETFIADAIAAILAQTRPPEEVVVVDDGSTDGTSAVLATFGERIRVIHQANRGCPAAFNRAFAEARGDFVAMCGADDIWEPTKLERQVEAIVAHPEVDVLFGNMVVFGEYDGLYHQPPGWGLLDSDALRRALYGDNMIGAPSIAIRRSLFERLGPFIEDFGADDYEYWMRCLRAGARFYFDPAPLVRYRRHAGNLTNRRCWTLECACAVRRAYAADLRDPAFVSRQLGDDLFRLGHMRMTEGRRRDARAAFRHSLRHGSPRVPLRCAKAAAWLTLLALSDLTRRPRGETAQAPDRQLATAVG